ncbi:hypothetical protein AXF42_Ash015268 [Apostasia shenzhenica]|uniref:Uncharacterized protein n=1 Tax=Apostasia shenzhenica TaxID=1088818 RepID=A0A2I0ALW7_9ASPA|nr:hypothetical protein AXF42_Ash015268 [Apostasia shenzhenica]
MASLIGTSIASAFFAYLERSPASIWLPTIPIMRSRRRGGISPLMKLSWCSLSVPS